MELHLCAAASTTLRCRTEACWNRLLHGGWPGALPHSCRQFLKSTLRDRKGGARRPRLSVPAARNYGHWIVTLRVPRPLAVRLRAAVTRRKASQSVIVREALEAHLRPRAGGSGDSFLDAARDILGSVDGPADLSTAKRHLRGYGR